MWAASGSWLLALVFAASAPPGATPGLPAETVLEKAQRYFEALRADDCNTQLPPALEFARSKGFDAGLELQQRISFLWQLGACAMRSQQFEMALDASARMLALEPALSAAHLIRVVAGGILDRHEIAVESLLVLSRSDPQVVRDLDVGSVADMLRGAASLDLTGDRKLAVYEALDRVGYVPPPPETDEFLRMGHARLLLERGRVGEARTRLAPVEDVDFLVAMRIERLFDPLRVDPDFEARLDIPAAMQRDLVRSEAAMAENPRLLAAVYHHLRNLDKAKREAEAAQLAEAVIEKLRADPAAFSDGDEYEPWILNELGYLQYELGRPDQGASLLREATRLEEGGQPNVSQVINLAGYLLREGRAVEMLALLEQAGPASPYGKAWVESLRSCAGVLAGNEALRVQGIEYLQAHVADNPQALSRALLCSNDLDGAAALMVRRLGNSDWRSNAIHALQRVPRTGLDDLEFQKVLKERLEVLRNREDVLRALGPVGRIETLPIDVGGSD